MFIREKDFQLFVKGDEKAFEGIFYQYYKTLVSFVLRYGIEQMIAEDVVIEVFNQVWQIRKNLKSPAALHSLLYITTRNRSLTLIRDLKNHQRILQKYVLEDEYADSNDLLMEEEMRRRLDEAVTHLPKQCEQVVLSILAGKSIQEISVEMQISVPTVKTYKLRAIQALRDQLKEIDFLLLLFLVEKKLKN